MKRQRKVIGLALAAVLALGAVSAVGAQGAVFHSSFEKTFIFGTSATETVLTTTAGKIKCKKTTWDSTTAQLGTFKSAGNYASTMTTVSPTESECTGFGQAATISFGKCGYTLTSGATATVGSTHIITTSETHAVTEPGTCVIETNVPSGNCKVTFKAHTPGEPNLTYANSGAGTGRAITVGLAVKKLKYTIDGPGTICGTAGNYENGELTGSILLKGYADSAHTKQVGIWTE